MSGISAVFVGSPLVRLRFLLLIPHHLATVPGRLPRHGGHLRGPRRLRGCTKFGLMRWLCTVCSVVLYSTQRGDVVEVKMAAIVWPKGCGVVQPCEGQWNDLDGLGLGRRLGVRWPSLE